MDPFNPTPDPLAAKRIAQAGMTDVQRAADNVRRSADVLDKDAKRADIPATAAERKRAAANDLREYADQIESGDREYSQAEAEAMETAGNCSGIVMDGGPGFNDNTWYDEDTKRQWRKEAEQRRAVLDKLVDDGHMVRVAEEGQAAFYALASYGGLTYEEATAPVRVDDDVDEPAP